MRGRLLVGLVALLGVSAGCDPLLPPTPDGDAGVDGPVSCGPTTCSGGDVCCNASCGICTPPDGVCIQLACENPCNLVDCAPETTCKVVRGEATCVPVDPEPPVSCAAVLCLVGTVCEETPEGAKCVPIDGGVPPITCASVLCIEGTDCVETPDGPQCVPIDGGVTNPPLTCAAVLCIEGTNCVETPDGPQCVPNGGASCAATLCPTGTYCDDIGGTAKCIKAPSCRGTVCPRGEHCELQPVQCIRAPCPAQPACVPDEPVQDPCAAVRCRAGTHCEVTPIVCVTEPCDPIVECVPDVVGGKCGDNTCGAGQFCCNPSCGICAPKGGACTQQFCGDEI